MIIYSTYFNPSGLRQVRNESFKKNHQANDNTNGLENILPGLSLFCRLGKKVTLRISGKKVKAETKGNLWKSVLIVVQKAMFIKHSPPSPS